MASKRPSAAMLWLTIVAAPAALGFETLLRKLLFPPEFDEVRDLLRPLLTPVAWCLVAVSVIASIVGMTVQRRVAERRLDALAENADADMRLRTVFGVFLLTTAVPQIPAILTTFAFTFGASIVPVIVVISIASVGVVAQALRVRSLAESLV